MGGYKEALDELKLDFTPGAKHIVNADVIQLGNSIQTPAFGAITTEMVAKSIAVAETTLAGHKVQFYMNPSGHDKLSSTIPCVAWMMKISEKDPLWDAHVMESVEQFHVPNLSRNTCSRRRRRHEWNKWTDMSL